VRRSAALFNGSLGSYPPHHTASMKLSLTLVLGASLAGFSVPGLAGTVITNNLPANTAIININARQDGAAAFNVDQALWYGPFFTGGATQLVQCAVAPRRYSFRVVNPADAAGLFPGLTSAQTNQIFTAWTYNSPWVLDYLVFDAAAATNSSMAQLFDGSPEWPPYSGPDAAYQASLTNGNYNLIRYGPLGRDSTNFATSYTFQKPTSLIFVIPDNGLGDNSGGVSILVSLISVQTTNLLLNPGAELGSLTNWTSGGDAGPQIDTGTFDPGITPRSGTFDFRGGRGAIGQLSQVVALVGNQGILASSIDTGTLFANVSFWEQGLNQGSPGDDAYVTLDFLDGSSNRLSGASTSEFDAHLGVWASKLAYYPIPVGTRFIQYTMNFVRHVGSDLDAFVDDNSLRVVDSVPATFLNIGVQTNTVMVSWFADPLSGLVLQQSSDLGTWTDNTNALNIVNGTNQVSITPPTAARFYRLGPP
jgi:hypothetical protein